MKQRIFLGMYMVVLTLPLLELALRIIQYQPYQHTQFSIESDPDFCILPHAELGFALNPGRYEVQINDGLTYVVTHGPDSLRITGTTPLSDSLPQIFMMGCSYTYGIGVSDHQSSPFLLQSLLPDYRVRNFAVPGYGTVQSYHQLSHAIERGEIPAIVVLNYADFHDERNALSPSFRKTLHMGFERSNAQIPHLMGSSQIPFLQKTEADFQYQWEAWEEVYRNWRGRESFSSINFLQDLSDRWTTHQLSPKLHSLYIFQEIQQICQDHNIRFVVLGLTSPPSTRQTLQHLDSLGMETLDISLDLTDILYHNFPFDSHPNAIAHQAFALRIANYLIENPKEK